MMEREENITDVESNDCVEQNSGWQSHKTFFHLSLSVDQNDLHYWSTINDDENYKQFV